MSKTLAVIVAGGKGKRMNLDINKQFIYINNHPLLYHTIKSFDESKEIQGIIVVISKDDKEYFYENIYNHYNFNKTISIVDGGKERQDSVYNGLKFIKDKFSDCDIVLIHDGARPFISEKIIEDGIAYAKQYGASAPGVTPKDTIKVIDEFGFSKETPDRNKLVCIQTPQCFKYDLILKCHENIKHDHLSVTDDTMAVERYGNRVFIYEGSYHNIKITTPEDLDFAEKLIKKTI